METSRTITLEILRPGPPHNQLLSPLVQYQALFGNQPAVTLRMPFEHQQLMVRLRALGYQDSATTRAMQLDQTARVMAEILEQVPGLVAGLAESTPAPDQLTHLRLILSASELALLPFELANAPSGSPGAGQPLALQPHLPLCLTREVRRVAAKDYRWPQRPKILLIAASPAAKIPLEAHVTALVKLLEPWLNYADPDSSEEWERNVEEHLVILPQADVDQIQRVCGQENFTHVHILAHGVRYEDADDYRFGLALHDPRDPSKKEIVDGERLAALLRSPGHCQRPPGWPAVVTLAACDSGNQGSVVGAGASLAHALHEAGIPLVVASQFPLSFEGSVLMTQVFYQELLWGTDPRVLLYDLRRQLKARVGTTHDWASIVIYAALPADLDEQLRRVQFAQVRGAINAAMNHADRAIRMMSGECDGLETAAGAVTEESGRELIREARRRVSAAKERIRCLDRKQEGWRQAHVEGLRASTEKREAEVLYRAARWVEDPGDRRTWAAESREELERSCDSYRRAFEADRSEVWALIQQLVIDVVLGRVDLGRTSAVWTAAEYLSELELKVEDRWRVAWGRGSLIELSLLALATQTGRRTPVRSLPLAAEARTRALEHAGELNDLKIQSEVYTTRRQIIRWQDWFVELAPWPERVRMEVRSAAREVADRLSTGLRYSG